MNQMRVNQAARLIRTAVRKHGWTRKVVTSRNDGPLTIIEIAGEVRSRTGKLRGWAFVMVRFTTGRKTVRLTTLNDYMQKADHSVFAATYALQYIAETRERLERIEADLDAKYGTN